MNKINTKLVVTTMVLTYLSACSVTPDTSNSRYNREIQLIHDIVNNPEKLDSVILCSGYQLKGQMRDAIQSPKNITIFKQWFADFDHKYYVSPIHGNCYDSITGILSRSSSVGSAKSIYDTEFQFEYKDSTAYLCTIMLPGLIKSKNSDTLQRISK